MTRLLYIGQPKMSYFQLTIYTELFQTCTQFEEQCQGEQLFLLKISFFLVRAFLGIHCNG